MKFEPKIFEISWTCHPELGSGSHPKGKDEMLKRVQHDNLGVQKVRDKSQT
jgi:hypothetical protein